MLAFVITFIIGTTIIIIFLANEIYNFKPTKGDKGLSYDAEMCPDYWKLEYINETSLIDNQGKSFLNANLNKNHFKYKCVLDKSVFPVTKFKELDNKKAEAQRRNYNIGDNNKLYVNIDDNNKDKSGINKDADFKKFKQYAANMNGYTYANDALVKNNNQATTNGNTAFNGSKIPMACDTVYPLYLSMIDRDNVNKNPSEPSNKYRCAYANACGITWTEAGCS